MTDPITKEGRAKFIEYARIIHSNPRMTPVGIEMLNKALAYEAALVASEAEVARLKEALRPFAHAALCGDIKEFDDDFRFGRFNKFGHAELFVRDFRRARAALTGETDDAR